jgi:hypothetical protein
LANEMKSATILILAVSIATPCMSETTNTVFVVDNIKEELDYTEQLSHLGMPDYASRVLARIQETNDLRVIKAKFISFLQRPFRQDQQIQRYIAGHSVSNSPAYWALRITQADAYWAWGKTNECINIYDSFMREFPKHMQTETENGQQSSAPYRSQPRDARLQTDGER